MVRATRSTFVLVATLMLSCAGLSDAIEPPVLMKEAAGNVAPGQQGCPLEPNLTGDCGNLRYYNLCSGYIWIFSGFILRESVGVRYDDPCIAEGRSLDKAITYFRNVFPAYGYTVDLLVDADTNDDSCPDYALTRSLDIDPALRWNCSDLSRLCIPAGLAAIVLRTELDRSTFPTFVTDGPFTEVCDPVGTLHSYYYGINGSACYPWIGPTGRFDNFLYWLIVDSGCTTATEQTSWGAVKGLFR